MRFHSSTIARTGALLGLTAVITACAATPVIQPPPTERVAASGAFVTSTTAAVTLPALTASGYTVTGSAPTANAAVSVTETISASAPTGVTPFASRRLTDRRMVTGQTDLFYVTFSSSTAVTLTKSPLLDFASSSLSASDAYYLNEYAGGSWTSAFAGPVTSTGSAVDFASIATPFTIGPNASVTFLISSGSAPPTPSPTPAVSTSNVVFDANTPTTQTFTVSESGYSGAFAAAMVCTENPTGQTPASDAYVAEFSNGTLSASETPASAGTAATFTVQSGAETGLCPVTITDTNGNTATTSVSVSSSSVTISGTHRP